MGEKNKKTSIKKDKMPINSCTYASYVFRCFNVSFNENIILYISLFLFNFDLNSIGKQLHIPIHYVSIFRFYVT